MERQQPFEGNLPNNTFQKLFKLEGEKLLNGERTDEEILVAATNTNNSPQKMASKIESGKFSEQTARSGVAIFEVGKSSQTNKFTTFDKRRNTEAIQNSNDLIQKEIKEEQKGDDESRNTPSGK